MSEPMQRSPGAQGQPSRDIVQEAPRRGGKWIWSRIKGLNQQLCKGIGPKEELEEKIGKLESILILRAAVSSSSRLESLHDRIVELECELAELRAELPAEEAKVSAWRSISLYGQRFMGGQAQAGWFHQENPSPNHWEGQDLPPDLAFKYARKAEAKLKTDFAAAGQKKDGGGG